MRSLLDYSGALQQGQRACAHGNTDSVQKTHSRRQADCFSPCDSSTILNSNFKLNSTLKLYTVVVCGDGKTFPMNSRLFKNDPSDGEGRDESFKN